LPAVAWTVAQLLLDQIRWNQKQVGRLEKAIEEQVKFTEQVERLKVLPGFGVVCVTATGR